MSMSDVWTGGERRSFPGEQLKEHVIESHSMSNGQPNRGSHGMKCSLEKLGWVRSGCFVPEFSYHFMAVAFRRSDGRSEWIEL